MTDAVRVVVVTSGGAYGRLVVAELLRLDVTPVAVIVDVDARRPHLRADQPRRTIGLALRARNAVAFPRNAPKRIVGNVNSPRAQSTIAHLEPDLLVLAGTRIVSAETLSIATLGALNAHPARLPGLRGTGVVAWSILTGIPVCVSVHWVTPQVDAGDVIEVTPVPIRPDDDLRAIEERADELAAMRLAAVSARVAEREAVTAMPQNRAASRLVRWPTYAERAICEEAVREGAALRLYRDAVGH